MGRKQVRRPYSRRLKGRLNTAGSLLVLALVLAGWATLVPATAQASPRLSITVSSSHLPTWISTRTAACTAAPPQATSVAPPTFTQNPIPADGFTTTTAKVAVTDGSGNVVPGDNVQFNLGAPCAPSTVAAGFNMANQDYEATLTATNTAGNCSISATDTTAGITGSASTLQQTGTAVGTPSFTSNPIPADGFTTTTAKVIVTDGGGNVVSTDTVQFNLGAPCAPSTVGAGFNMANQDYEATLTATTTAGNCSITATDTTAGITGNSATLQQANVAVGTPSFSQNPIPADGSTTTTAKVAVTDGSGNVVPGDTLQFNLGAPCAPST